MKPPAPRPLRQLSVFVPGTPRPAGSKRGFHIKSSNRVVLVDASGKPGTDWRNSVKAFALQQWGGQPMMTGPVAAVFLFEYLRPTGHFGKGKYAHKVKQSSPRHKTSKPDALKLARAAEDALSKIVYADDAQIVSETIIKRYGHREGCTIILRELAEPDMEPGIVRPASLFMLDAPTADRHQIGIEVQF